MGLSPILSVIHIVTIGTMLNNKGGKTDTLKNVTCKQTLTVLLDNACRSVCLVTDVDRPNRSADRRSDRNAGGWKINLTLYTSGKRLQ